MTTDEEILDLDCDCGPYYESGLRGTYQSVEAHSIECILKKMKLARKDVLASLQTHKVCAKHTDAKFLDFLRAEVPCSLCQEKEIQTLKVAKTKLENALRKKNNFAGPEVPGQIPKLFLGRL